MIRWFGLPLLLVACNERVAVELPALDEQTESALVLVTTTEGTELHALSAEAVRRGEPPLDTFGPGRSSLLLLPYRCTLEELELEPGLQAEAAPGAAQPMPTGLEAHALDVGGDEPTEWRTTTEAELARVREIRLDVPYLGCPELEISPPITLEGTGTSYGFAAVPVGDQQFVILTGSGRHFAFDGRNGRGTATLLAVGAEVTGAVSYGEDTYVYTRDGNLLAGRIDECLPGDGCFRSVAQGPPADRAWLVDGPSGQLFLALNHGELDASVLLRVDGDLLTEVARWDLGFDVTGFSVLLGGIVRDGDDILAMAPSSNSVVVSSSSGLTFEPLPTSGSVPSSIAFDDRFGAMIGTDFGTVHARRDGWNALPKGDSGFVVTQILPIDDGLLFVGQTSMDQYHPSLGPCGLANGVLVDAYTVVKQGEDFLVLGRSGATVTASLLRRRNPMPDCLVNEL